MSDTSKTSIMDSNSNSSRSNSSTTESISIGITDELMLNVEPKYLKFKHKFYRFFRGSLWIFPFLIAVLIPTLCIGSYIYAITTKQMKPLLPYISDTIGLAPQAGWTSELFDIITVLVLVTGYARYKQLKYYINQKAIFTKTPIGIVRKDKLSFLNFIALWSTVVASIGMVLIANCRMPENGDLHFSGLLAMVLGLTFYFVIMNYVTDKLARNCQVESRPITMSLLSLLIIISLVIFTTTCFFVASIAGEENYFNHKWRYNWSEKEPGYWYHVGSTILEWFGIVFCAPCIFLCLSVRFWRFKEWDQVPF